MIGLEYILRISNVKQKDLAEELGINKQNITLWLKEKQNIPNKYLSALSEKFNLPIEWFQKEVTELVDYKQIRAKAIDEFMNRMYDISDFVRDDGLISGGYSVVTLENIEKVAEQLKGDM